MPATKRAVARGAVPTPSRWAVNAPDKPTAAVQITRSGVGMGTIGGNVVFLLHLVAADGTPYQFLLDPVHCQGLGQQLTQASAGAL